VDGVTLQISVAPADLPHAREILPHQLRQWAGQVDEVLFVLDLGQGDERHGEIEVLLAEYSAARTALVDYSPAAMREVRERFFGGRRVPIRDCYGKVVYAYFYGLLAAAHRLVLHLDSDMMFGGGSQTWVAEAKRLLAERRDVLACAPLPGPPGEGALPRRVAVRHAGSRSRRSLARNAVPFEAPGLHGQAMRFAHLSTRDLLIDRGRFDDGALQIRSTRPGMHEALAATARGALVKRRPWHVPAETGLSRAMTGAGLVRVDFLGAAPGMWSLHPPDHSPAFLRALPGLIRRIEAGDVPDGQRGDFDLNASMLDG
jgi:hypothetical protein